ncbi:MotA/TolQ/ExbB proton channel family protein [Hwanghaeella grinnelliae]|uniref:MotA/TolQ/ExbB proton channel family protein n=1 Tax=Hwanghaeella grinnelliae TaxID=2500179 RepID=A0A437QGG3_9PROT|nr:MotA/TolQ/ExbB proton channel family protein [Hwanghaeella grinnelliae]RVU33648.1 MotA/TolQ/ExbB proton channel family protein [Hwanghaeella grinnelliae]
METETALPTEGPEPSVFGEFLSLIDAGGPVVILLMALSLVALTIVIVKLIQFRNARIGDSAPAQQAIQHYRRGNLSDAIRIAENSKNPVCHMLLMAIRARAQNLPDALIREELERQAGEVLESLRSWFRPLEVIATLAPLLGLFGTVLGMISAFQQLEQAGNQVNPAILSGGIWVALLTTAVGLAVAIPTVVLLNWLERKVDRLAHEIDTIVTQVFTAELFSDPISIATKEGPVLQTARTAHAG